ncbi:Ubiquitin thiolesterase [Pleurostoma richardsiae]|uniref:ubiquitinyl hydrolase 1 n=1 Tax=Pleurostoma richardsiae TaxID=41990 RepID=A0AA38RS63_9PEZI|nr:Ubiquitin thiolesterase [Pleurostoma richardsiae]
MFQPQPTPFAFAAYGVREDLPTYGGFQHLVGGGGGPAGPGAESGGGGGGGPLIFAAPAFQTPSSLSTSAGAGVGPGAPPLFDNSVQPQHLHSHYGQHANTPPRGPALSSNNAKPPPSSVKMEPSLDDDLAAQEAAAREYQPQLEGPLVGEKTPSHVITQEYAKADQVYVDKTIALPQTYSHYRPIQGDGNCGWRAIGFSYFETLIQQGDQAQVDREIERMTQLNNYILTVGGYEPYLTDDMVEETITLMGKIQANMLNPDVAMAALTETFNDPGCANSILYHLRLLAASYLKGNAESYEPFIPAESGVQGYCLEWLERPDREIDHLGITLLVEVLLKPVNFVLEIAYLDRSPGSQVNVYRFPAEANDQDPSTLGPIIYLLFRPDHYDILYRRPLNIQVNRMTFSPQYEMDTPAVPTTGMGNFAVDLTALTSLPGFGASPPGPLSPLGVGTESPLGFVPSPASPWFAQPSFMKADAQPVAPQQQQQQMAAASLPPADHPIRFNSWSMKYAEITKPPEPCVSPTFKNSHFNTAHFNNPNFQPEEYRPDADEASEKPGRKRSHGRAGTHSGDE